MRVLLVLGHRNKLGSVRMLVPLERELKSHGVDLFFLAEHRADFNDYPELSEKIAEMEGITSWRSLRGKLLAVPILLRLMRLLKRYEVDVLFAYHLSVFPYVLAASKLAHIPHLVALHNVYPNKNRYRKLMLHHAKNVLAVSQFMSGLTAEFTQNGATDTYVAYNGIDIDAFLSSAAEHRVPEQFRPQKGKISIAMVSAMDQHKDPQFLLKVARRVIKTEPNVTFLFIGRFPDPEYERETKSLAVKLKIETNVIFAGQQKNISSFFAAFDILAHPRPAIPEAFGLVLIEAMAHAKPVVASRIGGIPEIVQHNQTGILCAPGNEEEFAEALLKLIHDPDLRREYGAQGAKRVRAHFSIEKTAESWAEVFDVVAGKG